MKTPALIIITGAPGSGKSHLAGLVLGRYPALELISYDAMKETYFDRFGFDNVTEKNALMDRCLGDFFRLVEKELAEGKNVLIEYPFCRKHVPSLQTVLERTSAQPCTVVLYGDWATLWERQNRRDEAPDRHLGHLCDVYHKGAPGRRRRLMPLDEFRSSCIEKDYYIDLGDSVHIEVTDFSRIDYGPAFSLIARTLGRTEN